MRQRIVVAVSIVVSAIVAFAHGAPWYTQRGSRIEVKSSGFVLEATVPRGWSATENEVVPPSAFGSACRVRGEFYRDREWKHFLAAELDPADLARLSAEQRSVLAIGGHPAVIARSGSGGTIVVHVYINTSDLQPDSAALWTFTGDDSRDGLECEAQFRAFISSVSITLESSAGHHP